MKHLSTLILLSLLMIAAEMVLGPTCCLADVKKDRKNAAALIAAEVTRLQLHKIYVSDFLDISGARTDKGCYFSSAFATLLKDQGKSFEILNRIDTQKSLLNAGISAANLHTPESLAKLSTAAGVDAVLFGNLVLEKKHATLTLLLREAPSGKELYQTEYRENLDATFEGLFPAVSSPDGHFFYFAGLDGISQPKCVYCPQPQYNDAARKAKISGTVLVSAIFTEPGKLRDIRIVRTLDPTLDRATIDMMQKWSANPAKDRSGESVAVRVFIETTFHLY